VRHDGAFNCVLALAGAWVEPVAFTDARDGGGIRARSRRNHCLCGWSTTARYDVSRRRWRHLDMGATRLWLEPISRGSPAGDAVGC